MSCTQRPCRRHATTKCGMPLGSRATAIAGSAVAHGIATWSAGSMSCATSSPSARADASSALIDVPSTSVWQASRSRP